MAFTATVLSRDVMGAHEVVIGKYVSAGGSTGGDISHGLNVVHACLLQPWGAGAVADAPAVNETMPLTGGSAVTIVTAANESGTFVIFGN